MVQQGLSEIADQQVGRGNQHLDRRAGLDGFSHRPQSFDEELPGLLAVLFLLKFSDVFDLWVGEAGDDHEL